MGPDPLTLPPKPHNRPAPEQTGARGALWILIAALAFLGAAPGQAQTVAGKINAVGEDYLVVAGTRFSVDERTRVRPLPSQEVEGGKSRPPSRDSEAREGRWVPYSPSLLVDVAGAQVEATGRRARRIELLPYGSVED